MITILCGGSRGDFQPYVALARKLIEAGKSVQIVGPDDFAEFVEQYGVKYLPLNIDMEQLNIAPKLLEDAGSADNPIKMLFAFNKMKVYGTYTTKKYYQACEGSELIIYHPGCTVGFFAGQELGIPTVLASPFPMHRTKEYLSVVMYGKSKSSLINKKISYAMLQGMLWLAGKGSIRSFWKDKFGRLPKNFRMPYERHNTAYQPALVSCSNAIFKSPSDWSGHIHQKGYWFLEENGNYDPNPAFVEFLQADEKPVYIGFGSMSMMKKHDRLGKIVVDALKRSGRRGIISGFSNLSDLPKEIYSVDSVPHSWLFRHVCAVCHHGGAGTSAAGFRAGVPSIIVPFSNDQFAWAHRSFDLGIGVRPIYVNDLTSQKLAEAIEAATQPEIIAKACEIGEQIQLENGASSCAKVIVDLLG